MSYAFATNSGKVNEPRTPAHRCPTKRAFIAIAAALAAILSVASQAAAQNPPTVQTFYVPIPENQVFDALTSVYPGNATCGGSSPEVQSPISTTISIAVGFGGTYIYYDQWEDGGYDSDIANPSNVYSSPGNLSGTQIWGDGDSANGAPPGYPGDVLSNGDVIVLANDVPTGALSNVDFDGRDKLASSAPVAVTRAAWADGSSTLLAGAVEVYATSSWGTEYETPVGEDTPSDLDMFQHTSLVIMASEDSTTVDIDADANGVFETSIMLDEGESYHVNGGVDQGAAVSASAPVQVDLLTGDVCSTYEARWFTLLPTDSWSDNSYSPVSSNSSDSTFVFVYNPGPGSITVDWETNVSSQTAAVIAAGATAQFEIANNEGARFFSTGNEPFFAVATIDSEPLSSNTANDWGFALVPEDALTQEAIVGWGPGQDPTLPVTENSSPVWVMPALTNGAAGTGPFDICVDYDGDGAGALTDIFGNNYDLLLSLDELEPARVYDPDGDQTGMILYVCDNSDVSIVVAWGQDPDTASGGAPAIDIGTAVPPMRPLAAGKGVALTGDVDMDGEIDQGDTITYSIVVQNVSRVPVTAIVTEDNLPTLVTYVDDTTEVYDGISTTAIPDAGATDFPLDEGGAVMPTLGPGGELTLTFDAVVNFDADACGAATILNEATVSGAGQVLFADADNGVYCNPGVHVEKATNGSDADTPTGPLISEGGSITWTYVVTNTGDVPLGSLGVVDDQGVTVTYQSGDTDMDGLLDVTETWTYTAAGTAVPGQYANIGTVTGDPVDEGGSPLDDGDGTPFSDATDDDPSHYLGVAIIDLSLDKIDLTDPINLGGTFTYRITVMNAGPSTATNVTVQDTLDANTTYVSDTGGCTHSSGVLTGCNLGNLASGASTSFDVTVTVDGSAPTAGTKEDAPCNATEDLCNTAIVSADQSDPFPSNDIDDEPTNVVECFVHGDCDDGVACTQDLCVGQACVYAPNDAACSDGQFCNGVETCDATNDCQAGTAPNCNDGVSCTVDSCDEVGDTCVNGPDNSLCNDGQFCNGVETCDATNDCQAGTAPNCNDGVSCTVDSCDEVGDTCVNGPDNSLCNDGQFCNGVETCDATNDCQAGTAPNCNDGVSCTVDSCDEVGDTCVNGPDDSLCNDSQFCNGVETCDATNDCQAGTAPNCNDGVSCTVDSCDEVGDTCVNGPDDSLCNDSQFCNGVETCDATNDCQAGTAPNCDDGVLCTVDSCDEVGDACVNGPDDSLCSDGDFCTGDETCDAIGGCQSGTAPNCNDGVVCTVDSCDEVGDTCVNAPDDGACDDSQFCNGVETCDETNDCQAGTAPNCDDGVLCTVDSCDEVGDACVNGPDDSICSDGNFCTGEETCDAIGGCQSATPPNCDDGVFCTTDACDEVGDTCSNTPVDSACEDAAFCNGIETCDAVNDCQAGTPPDCDDGVVCTADACDEVGDTCTNTIDDGLCSDGDFCNGDEICNLLNDCQPGIAPDCNDNVGCTVDSCDEVGDTCVNAPDDSVCADGDFCNGDEFCDAIADCEPGTAPDCDDSVTCTIDTCDEVGDTCVNTADDGLCSDGEFCTGDETCDAVNDCQAGTPPNCDDSVVCTTDACDEVGDACVNTPDDAPCSDGEFCNGVETCDALADCQAGTAPDCDDGVGCTVESCDEVGDVCVNTPSDAACDNGEFCDGDEFCDPINGCTDDAPVVCDDAFDCSVDTCNEVADMCMFDEIGCVCGDSLPGPGEQCDPPASLGGDPSCDDNCMFICGNGVVGDSICQAGLIGAPCSSDAECDDLPGDGVCFVEECDPPNSEVCNNLIDDDGDGLIDCIDPDCETGDLQTCSDNCELVNACKCVADDPAVIKFGKAGKLDFLKIHGRVLVELADVDPLITGFGFHLGNADGTIYTAMLPGSELIPRSFDRWKYKNKLAKTGADAAGPWKGLFQVSLRHRVIDERPFLTFKIKAWGPDFDLTATLAEMTTQVTGFDDTAFLTATWNQKKRGWLLRRGDFPPCVF